MRNFMFGKSNGGGRRTAPRERMPAPALVSTIQKTQMAVLVDLSSTGARLSGSDLPPAGEAMSIKIDCVRAFGIVAWSCNGQCGISFDAPLPDFEVARLRRECKLSSVTLTSLDERLALDDWANGTAR